jgi:hypothetical protein
MNGSNYDGGRTLRRFRSGTDEISGRLSLLDRVYKDNWMQVLTSLLLRCQKLELQVQV